MELSFIVIDDTELDHFIARKVIANVNNTISIKSFLDASQALAYMLAHKDSGDIKIIIVFLDIYMPLMNGFQFMDEFEQLEPAIKDKYYIVALTSSRDISDINRINTYSSFKTILTKPITVDTLTEVLNKVIKQYGINPY